MTTSKEVINTYLDLYEDFEAPRIYLKWCLITGVAALLGRRCKLSLGEFITVYPNLFVLLIGPAGVRKSSAVNTIKKLLVGTSVRLGPTDTAGQRHGLMAALQGSHTARIRAEIENDMLMPAMFEEKDALRPANDMFLIAPELGRILSTSSREMADFLVDLWDGENIVYQTKGGITRLYEPLLSLLGATTPSSFATLIPENAAGHGILSRMLFVHADKNYKDVPLIENTMNAKWLEKYKAFQGRLYEIDSMRTEFMLEQPAVDFYKKHYNYIPDLIDPRLGAYLHRRPIMLLKVSMALAALRLTFRINKEDISLAHDLLKEIEPLMYRALEYFGKNKTLFGKMAMIEFLRKLGPEGAVTRSELLSVAAKDLSIREANEAIDNLIASGELTVLGDKYILSVAKNELIV